MVTIVMSPVKSLSGCRQGSTVQCLCGLQGHLLATCENYTLGCRQDKNVPQIKSALLLIGVVH